MPVGLSLPSQWQTSGADELPISAAGRQRDSAPKKAPLIHRADFHPRRRRLRRLILIRRNLPAAAAAAEEAASRVHKPEVES